MVEPVNNTTNAYNVDMQDKQKAAAAMEVQTNRPSSEAVTEAQDKKKQSDTVTISQEAVEAQKGAVQTAPEQARVKAMEEGQNAAKQAAARNNPMEAIVQAYGISK